MADTAGRPPWRFKASWVEACNCPHGCNCQFAGFPNEGKCEGVFGCEVKDGRFGNTSLNGLRFAIPFKYPKAIHEGNGHVVLFVDEKASQEQVDALTTILSGKMGGMPWEVLAGTIGRFEGPIRKPIDIHVAGEHSVVNVPGAIEMRLTPLKDPVSARTRKCTLRIQRVVSSGMTQRSPRRRRCERNMAIFGSSGPAASPVRLK